MANSDWLYSEQDRIDLDRSVSRDAEREHRTRQRIPLHRDGAVKTWHEAKQRQAIAIIPDEPAWRPADEGEP